MNNSKEIVAIMGVPLKVFSTDGQRKTKEGIHDEQKIIQLIKNNKMENPKCPECKGVNTYFFENNFICPDCGYEWNPADEDKKNELEVKDANGVLLQNGDTVVTIKNLPVKGVAQSIKAGTKVKNIRLTDGDHNIDCRIDGFGAMALKSEFVKKV